MVTHSVSAQTMQRQQASRDYMARFFPVPDGERIAGRLPPLPRAALGEIIVLPQVDGAWKVIPDRWVLPGCRVVTTDQLYQVAIANAWPIHFYTKE